MIKRIIPIILVVLLLCSCGKKGETEAASQTDSGESGALSAAIDKMDLEFTKNDISTSLEGVSSQITLSSSGASISGSGAEWRDNRLLITAAGTYKISGETAGYIEVDAAEQKVSLVLCGAKIENKNGPALYIKDADKVFLTLADGTENILSDGESYTFAADESVDGAVFSRADFSINGAGALRVFGNQKHAIVSKDDLVIAGGKLEITSKGVGIEGKDCVKITATEINIEAGSDGIRSTNTEDSAKGFTYIADGNLSIIAGNDGIQSETASIIKGGSIDIITADGSENSSQTESGEFNEEWMRPQGGHPSMEQQSEEKVNTESAKGIKSSLEVLISGGEISLDTADDSVHSNQNITINGGSITISSGDDGMHADTALKISGGKINILKSYEGLEATNIDISGGDISLTASDDGLNAAGGNDSSAMGGRPGEGQFSGESGSILISGGRLLVNATGDGVDSNGNITVKGGETYVSGPQNSGNGALDYAASASVSGGTFVATGASGMAQGFSSAENQGAIIIGISSTVSGGLPLEVKDSAGKTVVSFTPQKSYSSFVVSAPGIKEGETYTFYIDGAEVGSIEMTSLLYGSSGGMGGGPGGMGGYGGMGRPDGMGGPGMR